MQTHQLLIYSIFQFTCRPDFCVKRQLERNYRSLFDGSLNSLMIEAQSVKNNTSAQSGHCGRSSSCVLNFKPHATNRIENYIAEIQYEFNSVNVILCHIL